MSEEVRSEIEAQEKSGLLLSVDPLAKDTQLNAKEGDADETDGGGLLGDSDKSGASDADSSDGSEADGTDALVDADSTDAGADADGSDATVDADGKDAS